MIKVFVLLSAAAAAIGTLMIRYNNNFNENEPSRNRQLAAQQLSLNEYLWNGKQLYLKTALATIPIPDKVTRHSYQTMYGKFLMPYYHQHPNMKMLEIGLGCNMKYGAGASVSLYKTLFPQAQLWEAEYVKECVEEHRNSLEKAGINLLTGDQGDYATLDSWIAQSGGNFDVVIDDGGHQNCQIWNSFNKLWPTVKPGGLYFIEDMEVARHEGKQMGQAPCDAGTIVPEKLKEIFDVLIYDEHWEQRQQSDIEFIMCQSDACVLGKKNFAPNRRGLGLLSSLGRLGLHSPQYDPRTTMAKPPNEYLWNGMQLYLQTALSTNPTPDKVTRHSYQTMYGKFVSTRRTSAV